MQSEFPIRGELFTASLVKKFLATNVRAEFFIKISPPRPLPPRPTPPVAEKFHTGTYGIGRNPHGSKYISMGFPSDLIRSYPVTLSILSSLIRDHSRGRGTLPPKSAASQPSFLRKLYSFAYSRPVTCPKRVERKGLTRVSIFDP
ncbi:hypothetical protein X777_12658 [Ooceraea biroi]|uniref:Uncharacterized protein n=1 Tax=Ooceraea biroi TaxID=2015173 RepID=A0A026VZF1_OOCBI|nr:hypothetical protein X777_12658 [Ooceraea biroi]